jgi:hypothetical protein
LALRVERTDLLGGQGFQEKSSLPVKEKILARVVDERGEQDCPDVFDSAPTQRE